MNVPPPTCHASQLWDPSLHSIPSQFSDCLWNNIPYSILTHCTHSQHPDTNLPSDGEIQQVIHISRAAALSLNCALHYFTTIKQRHLSCVIYKMKLISALIQHTKCSCWIKMLTDIQHLRVISHVRNARLSSAGDHIQTVHIHSFIVSSEAQLRRSEAQLRRSEARLRRSVARLHGVRGTAP